MPPTASPNETKEGWIRVFLPYTRSLSSEEISSMAPELRKKTEAGDEGVWLEVQCHKDKCLTGNDKITIPVRGIGPREGGLWHSAFCPEDQCLAESAADVPS